VVGQASAVDTSLAVEVAIWLDSAQLLLEPLYASLLRCLVNLSLPKIAAIFLNRISGRVSTVTQEDFGLELVGLLLLNGSGFQRELIMEELMQGDRGDGQLPLLLSLASEERASFLMENLELTAEPAMLARVVRVLEQGEVAEFTGFPSNPVLLRRWVSRCRDKLNHFDEEE